MTKQGIIIGTVLVACLLGACVCGFFWMKRQAHQADFSEAFYAIPPDALVIQRFRTFEDLCDTYVLDKSVLSRFCAPDNGLSVLLRKLYYTENETNIFSQMFRAETVCSIHYTGKNNVHVLLGVDLSDISVEERSIKEICSGLGEVSLYKVYNKVEIYQLFGSSSLLYAAVAEGFLLAGTSPVVLESSIRHLMSGRSLMDNQVFASLVMSSSRTSESSLYINLQQFDKISASLLGKRMQRYTDFFTKSASWMALDGTMAEDLLYMNGHILVDKGVENYFATLANQIPVPVKIWEVLPASTLFMLSLSFSDFLQYQDLYRNYQEVHKKDKRAIAQIEEWENRTQMKMTEWFESLKPAEVALAWVPVNEKNQWVIVVRSQHIQQARKQMGITISDAKQPPQIVPNPAAGAFPAFLGPLFAKSSESHCMAVENNLFFGAKDLLESLAAGYNKASSLNMRMKQGRIRGKWMDEATLTCVLQAGEARDSLLAMCDLRYVPQIKEALAPYDYTMMVFQMCSLEGGPYANLVASADTLKKSATSAKAPPEEAIDTNPLPMAKGPFTVYNHMTKRYDQLEQRSDSLLVLRERSGKQAWRTRTKYAIADQVVQIDYLKNEKLQMLFASKASLQLLDRLGRSVAPYPKKLDKPVRKGPFLFDINQDKEYQIFLIHTDNSLRLYDRTGAAVQGWGPFVPEDRIEQAPVLLPMGGDHFWLVYGAQKDYILRSNGTIAVVLQRRNRIMQDAAVEIEPGGILKGKTTEGRLLTIQLNTGTIKTRKP